MFLYGPGVKSGFKVCKKKKLKIRIFDKDPVWPSNLKYLLFTEKVSESLSEMIPA